MGDSASGILVIFLLAVAAIGWLGYLIVTYWVWVLLFLCIAGFVAVLIVGLRGQSTTQKPSPSVHQALLTSQQNRREAQNIALEAEKKRQTIQAARARLEAESQKLADARKRVSVQADFQIMTHMHFHSMKIADEHYRHKRDAEVSERSLSRSIARMEQQARALASIGTRQKTVSIELECLHVAIPSICQQRNLLSIDIEKSKAALGRYNLATGQFRDHIRDHCGPRGRKWYQDLQARTATRNQ